MGGNDSKLQKPKPLNMNMQQRINRFRIIWNNQIYHLNTKPLILAFISFERSTHTHTFKHHSITQTDTHLQLHNAHDIHILSLSIEKHRFFVSLFKRFVSFVVSTDFDYGFWLSMRFQLNCIRHTYFSGFILNISILFFFKRISFLF